jgi:hypothetical protein
MAGHAADKFGIGTYREKEIKHSAEWQANCYCFISSHLKSAANGESE